MIKSRRMERHFEFGKNLWEYAINKNEEHIKSAEKGLLNFVLWSYLCTVSLMRQSKIMTSGMRRMSE
jgi:hypothetical protein